MIIFSDFKRTGHPCLLFGEDNSGITKRWLNVNLASFSNSEIQHSTKLKFFKFMPEKNNICFCLIFSPFFKMEQRKKKYQKGTWIFRETFSNETVKGSVSLTKKTFEFPEKPKGFDLEFDKKNFPILKIFFFQKGFFSTSCFVGSEDYLAIGSFNGSLEIFKVDQSRMVYSIVGQRGKMMSISSHPIVPSVFCSSGKKITRFWRINMSIKKMQVFSIVHHSGMKFSSFRKDGKTVDFGTLDKTWKSFDLQKQKWVFKKRFLDTISSIFYCENHCLVGVGSGFKVNFFDTRIEKSIFSLKTNYTSIFSLEWTSNNLGLICSGTGKRGFFWDLRKYDHGIPCLKHQDTIVSVAYHPTFKFLFSSSNDKTTKIWGGGDLKKIATLKNHKSKISEGFFFH